MKNVELIRRRIVRGQELELRRLRAFISSTEGNAEALAKMEGQAGQELLADVAQLIMTRLGHVTVVPAAEKGSRAQRAAGKAMAALKGE